jgi:hypothetical protein
MKAVVDATSSIGLDTVAVSVVDASEDVDMGSFKLKGHPPRPVVARGSDDPSGRNMGGIAMRIETHDFPHGRLNSR